VEAKQQDLLGRGEQRNNNPEPMANQLVPSKLAPTPTILPANQPNHPLASYHQCPKAHQLPSVWG